MELFLGISIPPVVVIIWVVLSILLIVALKNTTWGRNLYAVGGNRTSAARLSISERTYWVGVFTIGGFISALTGSSYFLDGVAVVLLALEALTYFKQ